MISEGWGSDPWEVGWRWASLSHHCAYFKKATVNVGRAVLGERKDSCN